MKIANYIKEWIEENGHARVSQDLLIEAIREARQQLAEHPIDLLSEDFDRDLPRLAKYLKVDYVRVDAVFYLFYDLHKTKST